MSSLPLHPLIAEQIRSAAGQKPLEDYPIEEMRRRIRAGYDLGAPRLAVASIADREIPGPGGRIPLRIYVPIGLGPFPVLVFLHGGGFCFLDLDAYDFICQAFCNRVGCAVVSVGYRLAPEHKWPAGVDDCVAAIHWVSANDADLSFDGSRIAIAGDSGGGCLAAATALRLRDEGTVRLCGQMLIYPVLDHYSTNWPSYSRLGGGRYGLTAGIMRLCWDNYLSRPEDADSPYAAPYRAKTFGGLPRTLIQTGEYDLLCDEGEAFAGRLKDSGVSVQLSRCFGLNHGFWRWWTILKESDERVDEACDWLKVVFVNLEDQ